MLLNLWAKVIECLNFNNRICEAQVVVFVPRLLLLSVLRYLRFFLLRLWNLWLTRFSNSFSVKWFWFIFILEIHNIWDLGVVYTIRLIKINQFSLLKCLWLSWIVDLRKVLGEEDINDHVPCEILGHSRDPIFNFLVGECHVLTGLVVVIARLER